MKRMLIAIGILLAPLSVHAQALSPWVQGVLDRTQEGIVVAKGLAYTSCERATVLSEIKNNQSLIRELVTPALQREAEAEALRENTVCFQSDKHLLELKLRELQEAMSAAAETCKVSTTKALRENYRFLVDAYASFVRGGMNPAYKDDRLQYRYPFQDAELWNAGAADRVKLTDASIPLCPYTTDFGVHSLAYQTAQDSPPLLRSFGCDASVLDKIPPPYAAEAQTLKKFMDDTNTFAASLYDTVSQTLFHLDDIIGVITGSLPPSELPGTKPPPEHATLAGCLRPPAPDILRDPPAEVDAVLSAYPEYFETYNQRSDGAERVTYSPPPDQTLPTGILHRPIVDFFLTAPSAGILARSFVDLREISGASRPLPLQLVNQMFDSFLMTIANLSTVTKMQMIGGNIEREMGILESSSTDALQRKQDASVSLEAAVQSLVQVVDTELPEKYIPDLAFFLARSCVDGHCQRTLEAVAKRTFNPYCHPYTSGKYLEEDAVERCYCDEKIKSTDEAFWNTYCSDDIAADMDKYNAMPQVAIPACMDDTFDVGGTPPAVLP